MEETKIRKPRLTPAEYLAAFREGGKNIVGTFIWGHKNSFVIPDDERLPKSMDVAKISNRGESVIAAQISGQKVVAKFHEQNPDLINIVEVLGDPNRVGTDVLAIIRAYNLYEEFPETVLAEARKVAKIDPAVVAKREDLRDGILVTIDPEDAKDLDDAVSLTRIDDATFELGVHIADVSQYVTEGSALDEEAFLRGTSVYFPGGVLPMLPEQLSNNICSLNPNVDRLALSCFMTIDRAGHVIKSRIAETVIKTAQRFSYKAVQDILDKKDKGPNKKIVDMLFDMAELTKTLEKLRKKRGEVILNIPEPKIILDKETGKIVDVIAYPHWLAHRIVETFMILCNETIAQYAVEHALPFVYRIHEKPDALKVNRLIDMLKPFGVQHNIRPDHPNGLDYQRMLEKTNPDLLPVVSQLSLRSMQKAKYATQCIGHFGLGSKFYCHFTSPIRRLPDLVIHRILKMVLNKQTNSHKLIELADFCTRAADQSSKTELTATEVEREVDNLKRAEYMSDHIGDKFSGVVSGVTDFGIFVYLPNTVEGLVKMDNLPRDNEKEFYTYNEKTATLSSKKRTIKMGDKIDVVCVGVNMARHQVEFAAMPKH